MNKAFTKAPVDVKEVVTQLNSALESKDYPVAYQAVQTLSISRSLPKTNGWFQCEPRSPSTALLQAALAQGDQKAACSINTPKKAE